LSYGPTGTIVVTNGGVRVNRTGSPFPPFAQVIPRFCWW